VGCGSDATKNTDPANDPNRVPNTRPVVEDPTNIKGTVLETHTANPIAGLTVAFGNDTLGWTNAVTDASGNFELKDINKDSTLMRLDGAALNIAGKTYPTVTTQAHAAWIVAGKTTTIEKAKFLPNIAASPKFELAAKVKASTDPVNHPTEEGWVEVTEDIEIISQDEAVPGAVDPTTGSPQTATVYAKIAAGSFVKFPAGVEKTISVTQVPVDQLPHSLPDYVAPDMMVTFQPGGTLISPPATLHFGDFRDYTNQAPTQEFAVWSLSHSRNLFLRLGDASLTTGKFGAEIATNPGVGLSELGWHGPSCGNVNFIVDVEWDLDQYPNTSVPLDNTITMRTVGGGVNGDVTRSASNVGGTINSGNMASCGGYFHFTFGNEEFKIPHGSYDVPNWRCARSTGTNHIGKITLRQSAVGGSISVVDGINLPGC